VITLEKAKTLVARHANDRVKPEPEVSEEEVELVWFVQTPTSTLGIFRVSNSSEMYYEVTEVVDMVYVTSYKKWERSSYLIDKEPSDGSS
jgi:hypothetical protein